MTIRVRAYLFISHDLAVVKYMSNEVLVMRTGEVVERGTPEAIFAFESTMAVG